MTIRRTLAGLLAAPGLSLLAVGCGAPQVIRDSMVDEAIAGVREVVRVEPSLEVARASFPALLKMLEAALFTAPDDPEILVALAEGWASHAYLFIGIPMDAMPPASPERDQLAVAMQAATERAEGYARRALVALGSDLGEGLAASDAVFRAAIRDLSPAQYEAAFWLCFAWSARLQRGDPPAAERDLAGRRLAPLLRRLVDMERSEAYLSGLPLVLAGAFFVEATPDAGRDEALGRQLLRQGLVASRPDTVFGMMVEARATVRPPEENCRHLADVVEGARTTSGRRALLDAAAVDWARRRHAFGPKPCTNALPRAPMRGELALFEATPSARAPDERQAPVAPWALMIGGGVAMAAGGALLYWGEQSFDDAVRAHEVYEAARDPATAQAARNTFEDHRERGRAKRRGGYVLMGVGAVGAVIGGVLLYRDWAEGTAVHVGPGGASMSWSF